MAIQGAINKLIGSAGAAATLADKMSSEKAEISIKEVSAEAAESKAERGAAGVDAKMAEKARRVARQKLDSIYNNKKLSEEAKQQRASQAMADMLI